MTGIPASAPDSWENEGQLLSPLLDQHCAAVVAGLDANAAAAVAIGIARAQGARRRVALADLIGEAPALEALNRSDDPHGISDSFLYGVSLNRIARQVNAAGSVFLMPSGTEAVAHEAVYANDRWRRLAAGFEQVGALLLIVAVPGTPGFAELCSYVGAVLPVGDTRFPIPAGIPVIAPPPPPPPAPAPTATPPQQQVVRAREAAVETSDGRRRKVLAGVGVLFALAITIGALWSKIVPLLPAPVAALFAPAAPDSAAMIVEPPPMDTTKAAAAPVDTTTALDSTLQQMPTAADSSAPLSIANPADSSTAARYAIFYASANSRSQALTDERLKSQPAVAVSAVVLDGATWYRVFIGASANRSDANILLAQLRSNKLISGGNVTAVPFALRLEGGVGATAVANRIEDYGQRGITAYALQQTNGTATLYTGAFETPSQASLLADSLRALGLTPVLAYRTGRGF
ncbi:MAG: SPOR domain-containing protein [Gemmatimonadaceae bacterium]|nr:SPOR domain-containing protein [Gemmatimonadaceae bacterium]